MKQDRHEFQFTNMPMNTKKNQLTSELEKSRRRLRVKHTSGKVVHSRCDSTSRRWMKNLPETRECGSESVGRIVLVWNERCSKETNKAACVHVDDAHVNSSNPDDHRTARYSEWTRDLETISGSVGASEQRSKLSDAVRHVQHAVYRGNLFFAQCVSGCDSERLSPMIPSTICMVCAVPSVFWMDGAPRRWGPFLMGGPSGSPVLA